MIVFVGTTHSINVSTYKRVNGQIKTGNELMDDDTLELDKLEGFRPLSFKKKELDLDIYTIDEIKLDGNYYVIYAHNDEYNEVEKKRFKIITMNEKGNTHC